MPIRTKINKIGKTTSSLTVETYAPNFQYYNWDNRDHQTLIAQGPLAIAETLELSVLKKEPTYIIFDEIHK